MFIVLISQLLVGQNEGNIWYFGNGAGLDFNSGSPVALDDGQLNTMEGCSTISDENGDLLFYTDGMVVYDKFHNIMPNGTGLLGHNSSTQSAIIVKQPQSSSIYYIFTVDGSTGINGNGLYYSEVDITLNDGAGDVTEVKNVLLFQNTAEKVTAVPHSNGVDFWIIAPQFTTNKYFSYLFTSLGVAAQPVESSIEIELITAGYLTASPDGTKLAACYSGGVNKVSVMSFDNLTGLLSTDFSVEITNPYGVAFSPDNNVLYITVPFELYQLNLMAGSDEDIINSMLSIYNWGSSNNGSAACKSSKNLDISCLKLSYTLSICKL